MRNRFAFTLIELLVVIAIIITLLAILGPSMGRAMMLAQRSKCLVNQRSLNFALNTYAIDHVGTFPSYRHPNGQWADAYGWRRDHPYGGATDREAIGFGYLVTQQIVAPTDVGELAHCPSFDNTLSPIAPKHCMDTQSNWGFGGSGWVDNPDYRIIGSFNYRGTSFEQQTKRPMKLSDIGMTGSAWVMVSDTADLRFRGPRSQFNQHGGYNRVFVDGSGGHWEDPEFLVDGVIQTPGISRPTIDGRGILGWTGYDNGRGGSLDEAVYYLMGKEEPIDLYNVPRIW